MQRERGSRFDAEDPERHSPKVHDVAHCRHYIARAAYSSRQPLLADFTIDASFIAGGQGWAAFWGGQGIWALPIPVFH